MHSHHVGVESQFPVPTASAESPRPQTIRSSFAWSAIRYALLLVIAGSAFALGHAWQHRTADTGSAVSVKDGGIALKSGPWGEMTYVPMAIAPPEELLPIQTLETNGSHWMWEEYTRDQLAMFLRGADVPEELRTQMLADSALKQTTIGLDMRPTIEVLTNLSDGSRMKIFKELSHFQTNNSVLSYYHADTIRQRFIRNGVPRDLQDRFLAMTCPHGDYVVFSGLGELMSTLPEHDMKVRLVRSLAEQKTLLLRLHLTPESNIQELSTYWGKAVWSLDLRQLLTSVAAVPGGTWIDVAKLLPPNPASWLYTFTKADNPLSGAVVRRDCHWTAFNFFRDPPDPKFNDPAFIKEKLALNYYPVTSDPRYGDLLMLGTPDGNIIHSAIYVADDILYTKNGDTPIHPWMLMRLGDLLEQYSFRVEPGQKLSLNYFRNKYY